MGELASCYFCGTIDGPLSEHPVVPGALDPGPDEQSTVVVCPSCREKLVSVQEVIADAADRSGAAAPPEDDPGEDRGAPEGEDRGTPGTEPEFDPDPDPEPGAETAPPEEVGDATRGTVDEAGDPRDADDEGPGAEEGSGAVDLPEEARQIVRLLQNREFPVSRAEIETVASSAYRIEPPECRAAVDALVESGVLRETEDGQLDRPG